MTSKLTFVEREYLEDFIETDVCWKAIRDHYGDKKAERSGIPLIHHIVEGLMILTRIKAKRSIRQAWCLHPIVQSDDDLKAAIRMGIPVNFGQQHIQALLLAMEYRHVANSFLSHHDGIEFKVIRDKVNAIPGIREMLIADKIQNWKDFSAQPRGTYANEDRLDIYFNEWCYDILHLGASVVGDLTDLITHGKGDDEE